MGGARLAGTVDLSKPNTVSPHSGFVNLTDLLGAAGGRLSCTSGSGGALGGSCSSTCHILVIVIICIGAAVVIGTAIFIIYKCHKMAEHHYADTLAKAAKIEYTSPGSSPAGAAAPTIPMVGKRSTLSHRGTAALRPTTITY